MATDLHVDITQDLPRPIEHVFHAIVDPVKLADYFITRASGPMTPGATVTWWFDDVGVELAVTVKEIVEPRRVAFSWAATGAPTDVVIELARKDETGTTVRITETGWARDDAGIAAALGQTRGWTDFLGCLKASIVFGVDLRRA
jgi:uncharacterized protein YndB with AHSA1/START domain